MHDSTDSDSETATTISDTASEYDSSDSKFYKTKLCAKFEVRLASAVSVSILRDTMNCMVSFVSFL